MTVRDIITGSLRLLGAVATGEVASASEAQDALGALNDMLDSWNTERLFAYSIQPSTYNLVAGKQVYTLGVGGDFNQPRPNAIDQAYITYASTGTAQSADIPLEILNLDQWASLPVKGVSSTFPTKMYCDMDIPLANVYLWPVPTTVVPIVLYTWTQALAFPDINQDVVFPPGYARCIRYNLAVELAPEYAKTIDQAVALIAAESKANLKRLNAPNLLMAVDPALAPQKTVTFDWRTGGN